MLHQLCLHGEAFGAAHGQRSGNYTNALSVRSIIQRPLSRYLSEEVCSAQSI